MGNRYSSKVAQADWILVRKEGLDDSGKIRSTMENYWPLLCLSTWKSRRARWRGGQLALAACCWALKAEHEQ